MKPDIITDEANYTPDIGSANWMKLQDGLNTIRILSHSAHFKTHYLKKEKKSVHCIGDQCSYCAFGDAPKSRWAYLVLNRTDKNNPEVKVLEMGYAIFGRLLEFAKDDDFGDIRKYDIKITKTGQGLDTEYSVLPGKDNPFSEKEAELTAGLTVEEATMRMLKNYSKPETEDIEVPEDLGNG